ncbi:unnamed protein product [Mesocestoides corti]|uniref:GPI ethanolamine phosphate transferase 2 C-terminal domain-containing protein n=1 Tax=Mesocestoides corti TaxID=53468 RepID=A0A0R3UII5_MESCO|nr:unnamed protein product [Mesocestoides corti]
MPVKMNESPGFIFIRFGIFVAALYFCVLGLFSLPSEYIHENAAAVRINEPRAPNVILMVVDALRPDMIGSTKYYRNWPNLRAVIEKGIVDCSTASLATPSVTGPRIKAIATGRIPGFIDILYNLNTVGVKQPSWVQYMVQNNKRIELYGDDTWLKLFPDAFKRSDGTSSFFVTDFYEVDTNVTRHLESRLSVPDDWDLMILHYLGLDHIGHVQGPNGDAVSSKLWEMDQVVGKLVNEMACTIEKGVFEAKSDQTDIATLIGLLTGDGVPAGSIGVPPVRVLQAFWPNPLSRYGVLLEVLEHLRRLTKCFDTNCNHELLVTSEISKLNQLYSEISSLVQMCSPSSSVHPTCNRMLTDVEGMTVQVVNLLTTFQRRTLLHANNKLNVNLVGSACLTMVAIAISFLAPGVWDIISLNRFNIKSNQSVRAQIFSLLAIFSLGSLLLHLISLTASSLIEEEHRTWYFFATSSLYFLIVLMISERGVVVGGGSALLVKCKVIGLLAFILCLDRFLLNALNQTGDKWIHLPDLTNWFEDNVAYLWIIQVMAWIVILLSRALLSQPPNTFRRQHRRTVFALTLVAFSQLAYRIICYTAGGNRIHHDSWASSLLSARLAFVCLAVDLICCFWFLFDLIARSGSVESPRILTGSLIFTKSDNIWPVLSPVHTFALLAVLLGRPSGIVLWAGVILKESLLAYVFHIEFTSMGVLWSESHSKLTYFIGMCYWIEGWTTFFQQVCLLYLQLVFHSLIFC